MKARLVDRREVADRTLAFALEPEARLEFEAGQACELKLLAPPHPDPAGDLRIFSIASSPRNPRLLFATRLTGSAFKRSLLDMPLGTEVELEGPFGSFVVHRNPAKPAVFLAGGIGITPFRSIIEDVSEGKTSYRITLIYSNRNAAGAAFLDDLERWKAAHPGFRFVATLSSPAPGGPWTGEIGRIDIPFVRRFLPGNEGAIWYAAGPDGFVRGMREEVLPGAGIDPARIHSEEFPGY